MSRAGSLRAVPFLHRRIERRRRFLAPRIPEYHPYLGRMNPRPASHYSGRVASPPSRLIPPSYPPSQPVRHGCFGWARCSRPGTAPGYGRAGNPRRFTPQQQ